ncbi:MAG: hypothetical protein LUE10_01330 [Alistipes sp.]|nr:hypothetical protein [Alistipes sp.]
MRKILYMASLLAIVLSGCSDDEDSPQGKTITVKASQIVDADKMVEIDGVRLSAYTGMSTSHAGNIIATSVWNDGFKLEFPVPVESSALTTVSDYLGYLITYDEIEVSDPGALICSAEIHGTFDGIGKHHFLRSKILSDQYWHVDYFYSDRPLTISGTLINSYHYYITYKYTFDIKLKKGWNEVVTYEKEIGEDYQIEYGMTAPSAMGWYFANINYNEKPNLVGP